MSRNNEEKEKKKKKDKRWVKNCEEDFFSSFTFFCLWMECVTK